MGEIAAKEIVPVDIGQELKQSYLDYAMSCLLYTSDAADD